MHALEAYQIRLMPAARAASATCVANGTAVRRAVERQFGVWDGSGACEAAVGRRGSGGGRARHALERAQVQRGLRRVAFAGWAALLCRVRVGCGAALQGW